MSMVIEENIMVPMRDGVKLATDVYRPAQEDLEHYQSMKQRGGSALARKFQHLISGTIASEGENDFEQAINRVYHSQVSPSRLILPVIERDCRIS